MVSQVDLDAIEEEVRLCFVQEDAPEHLAVLERGILLLNQAEGNLPADEFFQDWNAMMRSAHTLKGGAALSQLLELSQLAHLVEDLLQALSDRRVLQPELACQLLMCSIDDMRVLLDQAANGSANPQSTVLDDFKTFISTHLQSAQKDANSGSGSVTEESFLIRTVLDGDFKNCLNRGKVQINSATKNTQILQILTEVVQECGVLAEVLNLEQFHQQIQKITAALARTPTHPRRFAKRILSYLEQERKKTLQQLQQPESDLAKQLSDGGMIGATDFGADLQNASAQSFSQESPNGKEAYGSTDTTSGRSSLKKDAIKEEDSTASPPLPEFLEEPESLQKTLEGVVSFEDAGALSRPETDAFFTELEPLSDTQADTQAAPPSGTSSELVLSSQSQDLSDRTSERVAPRVAPSSELTMRVPIRRLDELADTVGEMLITYERLTLDQRRLLHTNRDLKQRTRQFYSIRERIQSIYDQLLVPGWSQSQSLKGQGDFDPLEMDEFTDLHSVLQDFQELLARIEEGSQDIDVLTQANLDDTDHLRKQLGELRHGLTDARMVPFATLADRFRRPLWDLNQRYEKSVQLSIDGETTLIDRAVLEHLYEPMLHLVRNAFDHGIESPKERASKGKPTSGTIHLSALHQGTQVVITVQDDGRGIDFEKVQQRAEDMGVLSGDRPTPQQLLQCLFTPGFSTKTLVSELSGRGVGLDVVKAQVENLRGTIQVYSTPGQGTQFKLTIPLTLNIMPLLVCQRLLPSGNYLTLAIPSSHISEIINTPCSTDDNQLIHWRGQDIPYVVLEKLMPFSDQQSTRQLNRVVPRFNQDTHEPNIAVILSLSHQPVAIGINQLLGEQEMVLKSFDSLVTVPRYFPGCTVLPTGQIVLVLAPDPLENLLNEGEAVISMPAHFMLDEAKPSALALPTKESRKEATQDARQKQDAETESKALPGTGDRPGLAAPPLPEERMAQPVQPEMIPEPLQNSRTIMVVDDSVAARRWMVRSLERSGYQVLQCRDGQDALDTLSKGAHCNLIICDIEMPRMNGFQLLTQIRQNPSLKSLPFALLTSRQGDRHRQQASQLGANGYFVKPLGGQQLLLKIDTLVNARN
ncbi:MAG: hybrid sensor histidine kinase/response regulator [Leptolyngbyaceae bacterium]|nr:hybrid sensor histidine kinase/response regulator [Leptolyngbyaceae bacterium]